MITFAQIQDRIGCMRPDLKPRQWQLAFQVSARRLAAETLGLQEVAEFTVLANSVYCAVYDVAVDGKEAVYLHKAEYQKVDGSWEPMPLMNQEALEELTRHAFNAPGLMKGFTSDQGAFRPNRPPAINTQVRAVVSYKPMGDFDEVDFGQDVEDALVEGALSHLLRLPGHDRDLQGSELSERRFLSMASGLRGTILIGDVGYLRASSQPKRMHFGRTMQSNKLRF
jgi:hypothetical protein